MNISKDILTLGESTVFGLRKLYKSYGYSQYKMSKFEEYDLYANNKSFLVSDNIITFTDTDGKLMALKPDVTLSIIRNARPESCGVEKVFYDENVYRVSKGTHAYKEIMQAGLECIGDIDELCISEVLTLAAKSLAIISDDFVLEISHAGIISDIMDKNGFSESLKAQVLKCMAEKNLHGIRELCAQNGKDSEPFAVLLKTSGTPESIIKVLKGEFQGEAVYELEKAVKTLCEEVPSYKVKIDFSVISDMNYYNGLVFKGYVNGVPAGVLSGGQYGGLVRKMGKDYEAIGFAVYLDMLEELEKAERYDLDAVVVYDEKSIDKAINICQKLRCEGKNTAAVKNVPEKLRIKEIIYARGGKNNG